MRTITNINSVNFVRIFYTYISNKCYIRFKHQTKNCLKSNLNLTSIDFFRFIFLIVPHINILYYLQFKYTEKQIGI